MAADPPSGLARRLARCSAAQSTGKVTLGCAAREPHAIIASTKYPSYKQEDYIPRATFHAKGARG
jgi:hypothetical protein